MEKILAVIVMIYMGVATLSSLFFWYVEAQTHGFMYTLFIGPIVGGIKGLLWPFFI
jgi:hypothetical protein